MKNIKKTALIIAGIILAVITFIVLLYIKIIPSLISNDKVLNAIKNSLKKNNNIELTVESPLLKTSFSPIISFSIKDLHLKKENKNLLDVCNFDFEFSLKKLLEQKIIINKLGADYIYADVNKITEAFPQEEKPKAKKENPWKLDLFNSLLYLKKVIVLYNTPDGLKIKVDAKDIQISEKRNPKTLNFDIVAELEKNNKKLVFKLKDNNTVFTNNRKLYAKNTYFFINNSKVLINYVGGEDKQFELNVHSKNFNFADISELLNSNIVISNGSELLSTLSDIQGNFNLDINMNNAGMNGTLKVNKLSFIIPCFNNLPINLNTGKVLITKHEIVLNDFKGYQGKKSTNSLDFSGSIKNYLTTADTYIVGYTTLTKEFTNDYLTKVIGYPLELVGQTKAKIKFSMQNGKIDLALIFRLIKGYDLLADGTSLTPTMFERAFRADVTFDGDNIELKDLNYYIANAFQAGVVAKPLLQLKGNFDATTGAIKNLGFEILKPLPSEFLNVLIGERIFKKGKISGNLEYIAKDTNVPYLKGDMQMEGVLIPAERMSIKKGHLYTAGNRINLDINGRYKRSDYNFTSVIANEMQLPVIVKKINLTVDNVDIERIMRSFNKQPQVSEETLKEKLVDNEKNEAKSDDDVVINTDFLVIEDCVLNVIKGAYKQINFGNVLAHLTLDRKGILNVESNKFDIAEGISSAKVNCDLKNQLYKLRLGLKDVNSDVIATSLLNLPREISGKARGLIILETDKSLKLNGSIKFDIKNGNITKVGLIEYVLNFVALFRNPLAMISPSTLFDLVNIPEGDFDLIEGSMVLKDNSITGMMIKSKASHLSSFIVGCYDLEKSDAILRIYTRFSNHKTGFAGMLRSISLNSLAKKVPLNSRNDSYYYENEINQIPKIDVPDNESLVFLTKIDGDVEHNNFISTLKRIK